VDSSLFVHLGPKETLVVLIYIDDLIISGNNSKAISRLKATLQHCFPIKDLGRLKYFLGIEMVASRKGLFLNQRKYVHNLLKDAEMMDAKPAPTPLDSKLQLAINSEPLQSINHYQHLVGKLIYLTITLPDITYTVSLVSQFMHAPTIFHLSIVNRILCYLNGSIEHGIIMAKNGRTQIIGYSDSNWVVNAIDCKSTTVYCMFVGGNLVSWRSKKQHVIARSSAKSEYHAMTSAACELIWLKGLLSELGFPSSIPMTLFCDNQVAMHIAANLMFHERTKYIKVDCHFIRQQV
jgi:hypothetical protein